MMIKVKEVNTLEVLKLCVPYLHKDTSPKGKADYSVLRQAINHIEVKK